ncbi:MAG TPA: DUF2339 domain-containing protein [Verrucomicrobiae bacterium]|jgi:uncharacterized membrane protein|nr:DUF2339 domain-containing protein [Verrucomicrobiae bacterium]
MPPIPPPTFRSGAPPRDSSDLEGKIGKVWLNRIGIVAILFGAAYFLKYAFDKDWIHPNARVAIGMIAGIGIVIWSDVFRRKNYAAFSYSLKAVGIGIMYLSLWAAAQFFSPPLIPVSAAFIAMLVVTAATIVLALTQDAELLAFYALIGGFLTPASLSTGQNHELALFVYVGVLDLAVLAMAAFKPWRRLFWASFAGTQVLYIGWSLNYYTYSQRTLTVLFTLAFGAMFALIPVVTPHDKSRLYKGPSVTLTLLPFINAGTVFLCLFAMYENEKATLTWYALGMAAAYLLLASLFKYRTSAPTTATTVINLLHVAIAIGFITIAIPLKLDSRWITIGWLIESAALLWIAVSTKVDLVRIFAGCTLTLAIIRLVIIDTHQTEHLLLNVRFLTYLVAIAILGGIVWAGERYAYKQEMPLIKMSAVALNVLALIALTLEAADYFQRIRDHVTTQGDYGPLLRQIDISQNFSWSAIWLVYGAFLMAVGFWKKSALVRWQALVLIAFTIGKVFIYDTSQLEKGLRILSFVALGVVLLGISFVYQRDWLKLSVRPASKPTPGASA